MRKQKKKPEKITLLTEKRKMGKRTSHWKMAESLSRRTASKAAVRFPFYRVGDKDISAGAITARI